MKFYGCLKFLLRFQQCFHQTVSGIVAFQFNHDFLIKKENRMIIVLIKICRKLQELQEKKALLIHYLFECTFSLVCYFIIIIIIIMKLKWFYMFI